MTNDSERTLTRREALKTIGLGTAGIALAACGGGGGNGGADGGAQGAVVDPSTPAPPLAAEGGPTVAATPLPPTPEVAQFGKGTNQIVFWHGLGGADGATMVDILKRYPQEKGVAVQSETYDWGVFYQKLPTSVIARTPPDMAVMHDWSMAQFVEQGLLQRTDKIFFDSGLIPEDDFVPSFQEKITFDGVPYGMLLDNHGWGLYYNTKLIKDAGLNPERLPNNGDEYIEWCLKLTTDENGKHPDEDGFDPDKVKVWGTHPSWLQKTILSTLWQFGGGVTDDEGKKAILDTENSIAAVQYWHDLIYKHRVAVSPTAQLSPADLYANNGLALMWDGSWLLNFFVDNPKTLEVTKAAPLPSLSDGKQVAWVGAHVFVIPTEVPEERLGPAKELIAWISNNNELWAPSGQVPARVSVQKGEEIQNMWSVSVFAEAIRKIGKMEPALPAITEVQAAYEPAFSAALSNTTPVKEALRDANQKIQSILDRS